MPKLFTATPTEEKRAKISQLQAAARGLLDEHNKKIDQIWRLGKEKANQLINTSEENRFNTEYSRLIEEIRALERECDGKATTGNSSPSGRLPR